MDNEPLIQLDDVEALISDLEADFEELVEFEAVETGATSNNSCCHMGSCYTF